MSPHIVCNYMQHGLHISEIQGRLKLICTLQFHV